MNAVIALCHFCEAHGPNVVFFTHTIKDGKPSEIVDNSKIHCSACRSIGSKKSLICKDTDGTVYCSRESLTNLEWGQLLKVAAVSSLSCEVTQSKAGGLIYFGDSVRGYILSYTFQLKDSKARGLKRWFSIIVFMKDKSFLLNIFPFLSEHIESTANELKSLADAVFDQDQQICSQRSLRLRTGKIDCSSPRSLIQLTGEDQIFTSLHLTFTWILKAGALTHYEVTHMSQDIIQKLHMTSNENKISPLNLEQSILVKEYDRDLALRQLQHKLGLDTFRCCLYCVLTGNKLIIIGSPQERNKIASCLSSLLPHDTEEFECDIYNIGDERKIVTCGVEVNLPNISSDICILEELPECIYKSKWLGQCPNKCPTLMVKIENALKEKVLNDHSLHDYLKYLQLVWLGIARTIKYAQKTSGSSENLQKLKLSLGATVYDEALLKYWTQYFVS